MIIKQAYEVYTLMGGGYNKRHVHGYGWTREEAHLIGKATKGHFYVGDIHLILINERWHRISVFPVEIQGNPDAAHLSRIALNDLPTRFIPAMFIQMSGKPIRLALDLEKAINAIAGLPKTKMCKLYTLRTGGLLPVSFTVDSLHGDEAVQARVFEWLKHEIEFRKSQGEYDEIPAGT